MERELYCGELIKRLNDTIKKEANNDLQKHGVTVVQIKVLIKLDHAEENTLPLKELERYFDVSQATMAGVIVRLERAGLVAGRSLCLSTRSNMIKNEEKLFSCLTQEEHTQLRALLYKVYDSVGGHCEGGDRP